METMKGRKTEKEQLIDFLKEEAGVQAELGDLEGTIQHVFTHLIWNISVFFGRVNSVSDDTMLKKVTTEEFEAYALPVSHQKIWKMALEQPSHI